MKKSRRKNRQDDTKSLLDRMTDAAYRLIIENGYEDEPAAEAVAIADLILDDSNASTEEIYRTALTVLPQANPGRVRNGKKPSRRQVKSLVQKKRKAKRKNTSRRPRTARKAAKKAAAKKAAPKKKNVEMGFRSGGKFHPVRASHDYDAGRVGEKRKWSKAYPFNMKGRKRRNPPLPSEEGLLLMGVYTTKAAAQSKASAVPGALVRAVPYRGGEKKYQVLKRIDRNAKRRNAKRRGRKNPLAKPFPFLFHGAFKSKADAERKEKSVPGAFIRQVKYPGGVRYQVVTRRENPGARRQARAVSRKANRQKPAGRRRYRNPGDSLGRAEKLYEDFHGRAGDRLTQIIDAQGLDPEVAELMAALVPPEDYTALGDLISFTAEAGKICFEKNRPLLCSDPDAQQLYVIGGDQEIDISILGAAAKKNFIDLGECLQVEYFTRKRFHEFEPVVYFHDFGDEGGERPRLYYDAKDKQLYLAGGDYQVKGARVDGMSAGITN